jgi:hypothetical protein
MKQVHSCVALWALSCFGATDRLVPFAPTNEARAVTVRTDLNVGEHQADEASVRRADMLYRSGKWGEAAKVYERVLSSNPTDGNSAQSLGDCYERLGNLAKAIAAYQAAAKIESARLNSWYALSCIYARTGDKELAFQTLNKAIDEGFDDGRTVLREESFESVRGDSRFLGALRRLLGEGFTGFDRVEPTKEDMRQGIQLLVGTIRKRSPSPYRTFSPHEWEARTRVALARVDSLDATGYFVDLIGLAGMAGDVHTSVFPAASSKVLRAVYPLRFWKFSDGLYIRAAAPPLSHLVGAKIVAVQEVSIDSAWLRLMSKVPTENELMSTYMVQFYMQFPGFLKAVGLGENDKQGLWTVQLRDGQTKTIRIDASEELGWLGVINSSLGIVAPAGYVEGHGTLSKPRLWLKNRSRNYWYEYLTPQKTVFLQINTPRNDATDPWEKFLDQVFDTVQKNRAERLVIDLRHNGGGYAYMAQKLIHKIIATPAVNQPGHLYVLTSRITQSAGVHFAVKLEQETYSLFVGEPVGAHPNFFNSPMGRHTIQALPGTDLFFRIADRWVQNSDHQDDRRFLAPDRPVPMSYADYAAGKDPALETALNLSFSDANKYFEDEGGRPMPLYLRWRRPSQKVAFTESQWIRLKR